MLGVVLIACNISAWELEAGDHEFLASLVYTVKSCALVSFIVDLLLTRVTWQEWPPRSEEASGHVCRSFSTLLIESQLTVSASPGSWV